MLSLAAPLAAAPIGVRHQEGLAHGFLVLRSLSGQELAAGELMQKAEGARVTSRLRFMFQDGSLHDEQVSYSQDEVLRLVAYKLHQSGPSFPSELEAVIEAEGSAKPGARRVRVDYRDEDGEAQSVDELMEPPEDLVNGLLPIAIKQLQPEGRAEVHMLAFEPKPRLVKIVLEPSGGQPVKLAGAERQAIRYRGHIDLGFVVNALAGLAGRKPPPLLFWVLPGDFPAYLAAEAPLYPGGPVWRSELTAPRWPGPSAGEGSTRPAGP